MKVNMRYALRVTPCGDYLPLPTHISLRSTYIVIDSYGQAGELPVYLLT